MLSRDRVVLHLNRLGTAMHRKVEGKLTEVYFQQLSRSLDDEQFDNACQIVIEEDERFPSIARLMAAGRGHRRRERGIATVVGSDRQDIGTLSAYISDLDAGRTIASEDLFRGLPHTTPMIERLVYEDAVATTPEVAGEGVIARVARIAATAEAELDRLEAAATRSAPPGVS